MPLLISELQRLKSVKGPKFLHVITTKGKGLQQAEEHQVQYHAPGKFDKLTGLIIPQESQNLPPKFQDVFGITLVELARKNKKIIGITPAMPTGSSLKYMMEEFPQRAFDVGIAEQHAVTLAAGMATQGMIVFCTIYSTFMQRAYDQIIHDIALQNLPVVLCLDRAGLVGEDGATHQGVFDVACLRCIPNLIIYSPLNEGEFRNILYIAQLGLQNPIAIRYPKGRGLNPEFPVAFKEIEIGKATQLKEGNKVAILSNGFIGNNMIEAINQMDNPEDFAHYDFSFVKPLDEKLLHEIFKKFETIITLEEGAIKGGFGSGISEFAHKYNYKAKIQILGVPDQFVEHATVAEQQYMCGLDVINLQNVLQNTI